MDHARRSEWYSAVLEEYKSLRSEAVTARDAQLSVLRLATPLLGAAIGLGVSLRSEPLLAGIFLTVAVLLIALLTFELWIGEIHRTIRAGTVVAAIERRLEVVFADDELGAPLGWERWLRGKERPSGKQGRVATRASESVGRGFFVFFILFFVTVGSCAYGVDLLKQADEPAAAFGITFGATAILTLFLVRAYFAVRGLLLLGDTPPVDEIWPGAGTHPDPGR